MVESVEMVVGMLEILDRTGTGPMIVALELGLEVPEVADESPLPGLAPWS